MHRRWRHGSPFFIFFHTILILVILPGYFESVGEFVDYHPFANPIFVDKWLLIEAHLFIFLFLATFLAFEALFSMRSEFDSTNTIRSNRYSRFLLLVPITSFAITTASYHYFGQLMFDANFVSVREVGPLNYLSLLIGYLSLFSAPLPALFLTRGQLLSAGIAGAALLIPILSFGAARQPLAIALLALFFTFFYGKRFGFLAFLVVTVISFPAMELMLGVLKIIRNQPDFGSRMAALTDFNVLKDAMEASTSDSAVRYVFYQIIDGVQIEHAGQFRYLLRTFLFWLPSFADVFGLKPEDFEYNMFRATMGGRDGTMHPTVFGSVYADSGWFVVPWVATLFLFMRTFERTLLRHTSRSSYLFFFGFYASVMLARGSLYAPVLVTAFVLILIKFRAFVGRGAS